MQQSVPALLEKAKQQSSMIPEKPEPEKLELVGDELKAAVHDVKCALLLKSSSRFQ